MIYTVGYRKNYDKGLREARKTGMPFSKLGAEGNYPGGFALRTAEDAQRLIEERGEGRDWAIYEVDADWDRDTIPSENGWWHALVVTSPIIRKAP